MSLALEDWDRVATDLAELRGGGLSAAARALGLAQPTLRRQVEAGEAAPGVALFTRGPAGLIPTGAGEALRATPRRWRRRPPPFSATPKATPPANPGPRGSRRA